MRKLLINYIRKLSYLIVLTGYSLSHAGSFEDFFRAIKQDDAGKVKELLVRGFDANTTDPKGQSGLYVALSEPSLKAGQALIEWPKTDANLLNAKGESALMLAALKGNQDFAEKLIIKGFKSPIGDFRDWDTITDWAASIVSALQPEAVK